jgi:hypothetical protein
MHPLKVVERKEYDSISPMSFRPGRSVSENHAFGGTPSSKTPVAFLSQVFTRVDRNR